MDRRGFLKRIAGCLAGLLIVPREGCSDRADDLAEKALDMTPTGGIPEREILELRAAALRTGAARRRWAEKHFGPVDPAIEQRRRLLDIAERTEKYLDDLNRRMDG